MRRLAVPVLVVLCLGGRVSAQTDVTPDPEQRRAQQHYRNGQQLLLKDDFAKAVEEFQAAIAIDPMLALAHYGLGQAYMGLKSYDQAIAAYLASRAAYESLAAASMDKGQKLTRWVEDELLALREQARQVELRVRANPGEAFQARRDLARINQRIEQLERMRQRQEHGGATSPPGLALALGSAYLRAGRLAEAEREYLAAVAAQPRMGEAHNNLAIVYMSTGRIQEARRAVEQAEKSGFRVHPDFKAELKQKIQ